MTTKRKDVAVQAIAWRRMLRWKPSRGTLLRLYYGYGCNKKHYSNQQPAP